MSEKVNSTPDPKCACKVIKPSCLHTLYGHRSLLVQFVRVSLVALLLAVLQVGAVVALQQAMLRTEMTAAEAAVADDALNFPFALVGSVLLVVAGRHLCYAATHG